MVIFQKSYFDIDNTNLVRSKVFSYTFLAKRKTREGRIFYVGNFSILVLERPKKKSGEVKA